MASLGTPQPKNTANALEEKTGETMVKASTTESSLLLPIPPGHSNGPHSNRDTHGNSEETDTRDELVFSFRGYILGNETATEVAMTETVMEVAWDSKTSKDSDEKKRKSPQNQLSVVVDTKDAIVDPKNGTAGCNIAEKGTEGISVVDIQNNNQDCGATFSEYTVEGRNKHGSVNEKNKTCYSDDNSALSAVKDGAQTQEDKQNIDVKVKSGIQCDSGTKKDKKSKRKERSKQKTPFHIKHEHVNSELFLDSSNQVNMSKKEHLVNNCENDTQKCINSEKSTEVIVKTTDQRLDHEVNKSSFNEGKVESRKKDDGENHVSQLSDCSAVTEAMRDIHAQEGKHTEDVTIIQNDSQVESGIQKQTYSPKPPNSNLTGMANLDRSQEQPKVNLENVTPGCNNAENGAEANAVIADNKNNYQDCECTLESTKTHDAEDKSCVLDYNSVLSEVKDGPQEKEDMHREGVEFPYNRQEKDIKVSSTLFSEKHVDLCSAEQLNIDLCIKTEEHVSTCCDNEESTIADGKHDSPNNSLHECTTKDRKTDNALNVKCKSSHLSHPLSEVKVQVESHNEEDTVKINLQSEPQGRQEKEAKKKEKKKQRKKKKSVKRDEIEPTPLENRNPEMKKSEEITECVIGYKQCNDSSDYKQQQQPDHLTNPVCSPLDNHTHKDSCGLNHDNIRKTKDRNTLMSCDPKGNINTATLEDIVTPELQSTSLVDLRPLSNTQSCVGASYVDSALEKALAVGAALPLTTPTMPEVIESKGKGERATSIANEIEKAAAVIGLEKKEECFAGKNTEVTPNLAFLASEGLSTNEKNYSHGEMPHNLAETEVKAVPICIADTEISPSEEGDDQKEPLCCLEVDNNTYPHGLLTGTGCQYNRAAKEVGDKREREGGEEVAEKQRRLSGEHSSFVRPQGSASGVPSAEREECSPTDVAESRLKPQHRSEPRATDTESICADTLSLPCCLEKYSVANSPTLTEQSRNIDELISEEVLASTCEYSNPVLLSLHKIPADNTQQVQTESSITKASDGSPSQSNTVTSAMSAVDMNVCQIGDRKNRVVHFADSVKEEETNMALGCASLPPITVHESLHHPVFEASYVFQDYLGSIKSEIPKEVAVTKDKPGSQSPPESQKEEKELEKGVNLTESKELVQTNNVASESSDLLPVSETYTEMRPSEHHIKANVNNAKAEENFNCEGVEQVSANVSRKDAPAMCKMKKGAVHESKIKTNSQDNSHEIQCSNRTKNALPSLTNSKDSSAAQSTVVTKQVAGNFPSHQISISPMLSHLESVNDCDKQTVDNCLADNDKITCFGEQKHSDSNANYIVDANGNTIETNKDSISAIVPNAKPDYASNTVAIKSPNAGSFTIKMNDQEEKESKQNHPSIILEEESKKHPPIPNNQREAMNYEEVEMGKVDTVLQGSNELDKKSLGDIVGRQLPCKVADSLSEGTKGSGTGIKSRSLSHNVESSEDIQSAEFISEPLIEKMNGSLAQFQASTHSRCVSPQQQERPKSGQTIDAFSDGCPKDETEKKQVVRMKGQHERKEKESSDDKQVKNEGIVDVNQVSEDCHIGNQTQNTDEKNIFANITGNDSTYNNQVIDVKHGEEGIANPMLDQVSEKLGFGGGGQAQNVDEKNIFDDVGVNSPTVKKQVKDVKERKEANTMVDQVSKDFGTGDQAQNTDEKNTLIPANESSIDMKDDLDVTSSDTGSGLLHDLDGKSQEKCSLSSFCQNQHELLENTGTTVEAAVSQEHETLHVDGSSRDIQPDIGLEPAEDESCGKIFTDSVTQPESVNEPSHINSTTEECRFQDTKLLCPNKTTAAVQSCLVAPIKYGEGITMEAMAPLNGDKPSNQRESEVNNETSDKREVVNLTEPKESRSIDISKSPKTAMCPSECSSLKNDSDLADEITRNIIPSNININISLSESDGTNIHESSSLPSDDSVVSKFKKKSAEQSPQCVPTCESTVTSDVLQKATDTMSWIQALREAATQSQPKQEITR